ncbi:MAG: transporter substrate-binding protein, partial [Thermomicrobiales bacterium]|nr:transporter substrate-binding protein [Thermomicrobiales bacterium]
RGDWETREGWGWASMEDWNLFLTTIRDIGQLTRDITAEEIISNDFDMEQVTADASDFELAEEFAAVEVPEGAGA